MKTLQGTIDGQEREIRQFMNCDSMWIVYGIQYIACQLLFVGCTNWKVKTRIRGQ